MRNFKKILRTLACKLGIHKYKTWLITNDTNGNVILDETRCYFCDKLK